MLRILSAVFATVLCLSAAHAEPEVCNSVRQKDGEARSPFLFIDWVIVEAYIPRAVCGLDVSDDLRFWRSFYQHYGCSPDSEHGGAVEEWLQKGPGWRQAEFDQFKQENPVEAAELCEKARACQVPEVFDPEQPVHYCPLGLK